MAASNHPTDPSKTPGYQLGDLLVPSAKRAAQRPPAALAQPARVQPATAPLAKGAPRNLTFAEGDHQALELDLDHGPAKAPGNAAPPSQGLLGSSGIGDGFDDDDALAALPTLEVEAVDRRSESRVSADGADQDPRITAARESALTRQLADYGPVPSGLLASVPYAVRVVSRLISLTLERRHVRQHLAQAERGYHEALSAMGAALMALAERPELKPLAPQVAAVRDAQAAAARAGETISAMQLEEQQQLAELEREAEGLRVAMAPFVAREAEAARVHKQAEDQVKRAQALLKRTEIEIRAMAEATTPIDPGRMLDLQSQREERQEALTALSPPLAEAERVLGEARRELALRQGAVDAIAEKKRAITEQAQARRAQAQQQVQAAQGAHQQALCALAKAAREQGCDGPVTAQHGGPVRDAELAWREATRAAARYDTALKLYNRGALIRGVAVVLALFGAALFALLAQ